MTPDCTERARAFYARFVDEVVPARGTREAEMAKLLENTYRHVNIALVNEMARFCHELDIDLWDVIELAADQAVRVPGLLPRAGRRRALHPHRPQLPRNGSEQRLGYPFRFVELAQEINASMPAYVAQRAQNLLNDNRRPSTAPWCCCSASPTRPTSPTSARSRPRWPPRLLRLGAEVVYHDPYVASWSVPGTRPATDLMAEVAAADLVILVQQHREYDVAALGAAARAVPGHPRGDHEGRLEALPAPVNPRVRRRCEQNADRRTVGLVDVPAGRQVDRGVRRERAALTLRFGPNLLSVTVAVCRIR